MDTNNTGLILIVSYYVNSKLTEFEVPCTEAEKTIIDIVMKIKNCPSEELKQLAYTEDLKQVWEEQRNTSLAIADMFKNKVFEHNIDFFEGLTAVNKKGFTLLDAIAERFFAIWRLINYCFPVIEKKLPNCPSTAVDLFIRIVDHEQSASFEKLITTDYIEVLPTHTKNHAREQKRFCEYWNKKNFSVKQNQKCKQNTPSYLKGVKESPWYEVLEIIENEKKLRTNKVRMLNLNYNNAMEYFYSSLEAMNEARDNNNCSALKPLIYKNGIRKKQ